MLDIWEFLIDKEANDECIIIFLSFYLNEFLSLVCALFIFQLLWAIFNFCILNCFLSDEYVICNGCKSPDTILSKENRLFFLRCEQVILVSCLWIFVEAFEKKEKKRKLAQSSPVGFHLTRPVMIDQYMPTLFDMFMW